MIDITFLGHSCFKASSKQTTLLFDPTDINRTKKPIKLEPDVVLTTDKTNQMHNNTSLFWQKSFVISGPGEYEISKATVVGVLAQAAEIENGGSKNITIYQISIDGLTIGHLGNLGEKLSQQQLEIIGGVDTLMIPVGGKYSLGAKGALEVISQIEPKIVIPMHFSIPGQNNTLATMDQFISQIGKEKISQSAKLSISKDRLPEEMQVVVMTES